MVAIWNPLLETLDPHALEDRQIAHFRNQARWACDQSPFYASVFEAANLDPATIDSWDDLRKVPLTTKEMLRDAQAAGEGLYGNVLAVSPEEVTEYHQTSGTTGTPIRQADSRLDWEWWTECWAMVLWAAGVRSDDRVFLPFSYNVFIGFWAAHYASQRIGAEVIPGGSLSSVERIQMIDTLEPTTIMTTPTYALRLTEVADEEGITLSSSAVERIICAGEIGASVPATRDRLTSRWGATVYDHAGATETGAWAFSCDTLSTGLHLNEAMFVIEILDADDEPVAEGEEGRLVITPLGRRAQPVIRFDQGDRVVKGSRNSCACGRSFRVAPGGILGRSDDFKMVNGVLISPRAIEDVIRKNPQLADAYRVELASRADSELDIARVRVEAAPDSTTNGDRIVGQLARELKQACGHSFEIDVHEPGALERAEHKGNRVEDRRGSHG